jgi:hypothetical protein
VRHGWGGEATGVGTQPHINRTPCGAGHGQGVPRVEAQGRRSGKVCFIKDVCTSGTNLKDKVLGRWIDGQAKPVFCLVTVAIVNQIHRTAVPRQYLEHHEQAKCPNRVDKINLRIGSVVAFANLAGAAFWEKISRHTVARLTHHGMSTDVHQRLPLEVSQHDFEAADHIVAVKEAEHRPLIQANFPSWLDRVEFWEVHDVDFATPEEAIRQLEREVLGLMERLAFRGRKAS